MIAKNRADVHIPSHAEMLWPILQAIKDLGDSGTNQEIEERAIEIASYSEEQQAILHGDGPRTEIRYRMAWARTYLKAVGALENSGKGVWSITDYGRVLTAKDMRDIPSQVRAQSSRAQRSLKKRTTKDHNRVEAATSIGGNGQIFTSTVFEEWKDNLLSVVQTMSPSSFEKLCQRVLRESGFTRVEITGRSGDGGIDGIGVLRIALLSFHVFFQCKRYRGSVGAGAIRDFRGAMVGRTDKGLFITTGSFTPEAKREATRDGAPVLDLIDGETLSTILKDLSLGINTRQVEEVSVDADWFTSV